MKAIFFASLVLIFAFLAPVAQTGGAGREDASINSLRLIVAVTPSNTDSVVIQGRWPRALYVTVKGGLSITTISGTNITIDSLAPGVWHPMMFKRVRSTGTTATGILAGR